MENLSVGTRILHERYGEGIISKNGLTSYEVFFANSGKLSLAKSSFEAEVLEEGENTEESSNKLSLAEVEQVLSSVLDKFGTLNEEVNLAERWQGGKMILQPENTDLASKEIPIETFFHKIVMMRDRLRVLEQNINSHKTLSDADKVGLQQYISRIYGSMTTFNILFSDKEQYFVGQKTK